MIRKIGYRIVLYTISIFNILYPFLGLINKTTKMKLTKKQIKLNKKLKHQQTKSYLAKQAKKEIKLKDKEWQLLVKTRDENKCIICGRNDILHVHHLVPREIKEYRWLIYNGVTLCPAHHKYLFTISAHRNSFAFWEWMYKNRKEQIELLKLNLNEFYGN